ncbi:uncharacterized protein LACBIDRAFT_311818 [Laccaria bicolor S238N-H82]|uniref:Predicted protein n=1 Tax=Laccaria bicolor (strain S238N-H82 / ATCC MYA-4686) TaxID=486041 RepID=B0CYD3_LACBS|nr:uncharacterized protein LACBIDRAFT_311818 [Laccaria bicolor S238N-H82]EDR12428.1 predicted protein [Laccaria bicolor S238N-H82]|eukprot:XP_001876692.1 predicted protein [Laccaria bicolor S238N-H82]
MDSDLPPPAYSEQEFDRKVATVAQISLNTPQPAYTDEEGWEEFDEAAYERAAAALASLNVAGQGSGSNQVINGASSQWRSDDKPSKASSTSIEPLRIDKKSKLGPTETVTKPRPSWLADAEHMPPSQTAGSSSSFVDGRDYTAPAQPHSDGEERSSPPPPSFEAEAPSWGNHAAENAVPLSYHGGSSTQPSPLVSPQTPEAVLPQSTPLSPLDMQFQTYPPPHQQQQPHIQNTYNQLQGRPVRQSLPVPPTQQTLHVVPEPRPTSFAPPSMRFAPSPPPQMNFHSSVAYGNPSVAYGKRTLGNEMPVVQTQQQQQPQQQYRQPGPPLTFDPKDFYNSAVSAHLSTPERATQARRPYSSIPSQHGLQNMQPVQSYNQQANNNQWPQPNNALGVYSPTPALSSNQRQTVVQPHPTYPSQPLYSMPSYGTNNNQWGGYYQ